MRRSICTKLVLSATFFALVNMGTLAGIDLCYMPIEVDCPVSKPYCTLRGWATCTSSQGYHAFRNKFGESPVIGPFDTESGDNAACWAECECIFLETGGPPWCICDEGTIGAPWSLSTFGLTNCIIEP
jgi:hypothetical protein